MLPRYEPRRGDDRGKPVLTRSVPNVASVGAWKGLKIIFCRKFMFCLMLCLISVKIATRLHAYCSLHHKGSIR